MKIANIQSSKLDWEVFQHSDGSRTYCADGDGFVSLTEQRDFELWFGLDEQGSPVGEIHGKTLEEALEVAQNYLAANYNAIFQDMRLDK